MSRDECASRSSDFRTASCLSTDVAEPLLARRALAAVGALGARLPSRAAGSRCDSSEAASALPSVRARMPSETISAHRLSTPDGRGSREQAGPRSATTSALTSTSLQGAQARAGGIRRVAAVLRANSLCRRGGAPKARRPAWTSGPAFSSPWTREGRWWPGEVGEWARPRTRTPGARVKIPLTPYDAPPFLAPERD